MKVLLTGASGFLGRNIAKALTGSGHTVIPASRQHGIDFQRMQQAADWLPHLHGIDAVVNCVGIIGERGGQTFDALHRAAPIALFRACVDAGVRRVIQVSALGADDTAFSGYHLSKLAADDVLRQSDLDWFVLRPTLVYGRTGTSSAMFMRLATLPVIPLIEDGQQTVQPVHVSDVVATVSACLASSKPQQTIDVVGGQRLAFKEWLQFMRQAQGLAPAKFLPIPVWLVMATTYVGQYIDPMISRDNIRMLLAGQTGEAQVMAELLGRKPLSPNAALFFLCGCATQRFSRECDMTYTLLKTLHILSMVLLFGTGLGSAFYKWMADRQGNVSHIALTNRHVVLADWLFTTPTVIFQPLSGLWMALLASLPITTPWIAASLALYFLAGACWLPVVYLQIRMRQMSALAAETQAPLPAAYWRIARWWFWLGVPAFTAMVLVVFLMVFKQFLEVSL